MAREKPMALFAGSLAHLEGAPESVRAKRMLY